jgi:glyoxylase-like metal-dependent hydrolase (beta-lactamase superfamily II)
MAPIEIEPFHDPQTGTLTYVLHDPATRDAVVIDPVLDYEPKASEVSTASVERVIAFLRANGLRLRWVLETHAHADHLSGSQPLKAAFPEARLAVGEHIRDVQALFKQVFDLPADFPTDGRQFDRLLRDGEVFEAGSIGIEVIPTPGHTPACVTYRTGDAVFTGDALFLPDLGTGRCDFPGGSSAALWESIHERLYRLPDDTRVFVGHDYGPGGREVAWQTTVGEQKRANVMLRADTSKADYVAKRDARDRTLEAPALLFQSIQVNIDAGHLPPQAENRVRYLRIPINVFRPEPAGDIELHAVGAGVATHPASASKP